MTTKPALNRTLHLVDVENLSGSSLCTLPNVQATADDYLSLLPPSEGDLYVIATSCGNAAVGYFGWPTSAQRLMRSGENGADLALLESYSADEMALKFDRVVIGSGDGIFTDLVVQLSHFGCQVAIVSRSKSLSKRLRLAASTIVLLPDFCTESESSHVA